ncbi:hypothetical protein GMOD_00010113 [Pyrenophora seminiperda CCB06]|uniref:Uncharacterized protein n=1 Tax=Pyrenophora seminiperda CCB06 TaxID=1302712 RepID=A0A3M7LZN3_9PLEO|nr:hypothetical protein GMOD_00010113 [Pyrenophora seminiperda CCB06]
MDKNTSKWNKPIPVSKQEPNGRWSNSPEFEAMMQGNLPESGSDVADMGDEHDGDKGAENGSNTTAGRMAQRSDPEQSDG